MVRRWIGLALVLSLAMTLAPGVARAGVWDDGTTGGPFDLRWVGAVRMQQNARIKLTVSFWPGFTVSALPWGRSLLPDPREHVWVTVKGSDDFSKGAFSHSGYFFRQGGRIWFRNGEFGSSPCCWTSPVARLGRNTLRVRFIPFWVRFDYAGIDIPIRYRVATRWCGGGTGSAVAVSPTSDCVRDHVRWVPG
jgi:hypothetical protein